MTFKFQYTESIGYQSCPFLDNRSVPLGKLGKTVSFFLFKICVLKKDKVIPNSERICQKLDNFLNFQKIKLSDFWITFICKIDKVVRISDNISKLIFKKRNVASHEATLTSVVFPLQLQPHFQQLLHLHQL